MGTIRPGDGEGYLQEERGGQDTERYNPVVKGCGRLREEWGEPENGKHDPTGRYPVDETGEG